MSILVVACLCTLINGKFVDYHVTLIPHNEQEIE